MFYIIDKSTCTVYPAYNARCASIYMLGRTTAQYTIVKSDEAGDRVVTITSNDVHLIEQACVDA